MGAAGAGAAAGPLSGRRQALVVVRCACAAGVRPSLGLMTDLGEQQLAIRARHQPGSEAWACQGVYPAGCSHTR